MKITAAVLISLCLCGCQFMTSGVLNRISENGVTIMNDSHYTLTIHPNGSHFGSRLTPGEHLIIPVEMVFENRTTRLDVLAKAFREEKYIGSVTYIVWIQHCYSQNGSGYGNNLPQTIIFQDHSFTRW